MSTSCFLIIIGMSASVWAESESLQALKSKSSLGFCEGNFYMPKTKPNCPHGFLFGDRAPKCVCIKGIYRMYTSDCQVADGFAEEVCTLVKDEMHDVRLRGVKLTKEPRWDKTALVCEKGQGNAKDWEYVPEFGRARTSSKFFYTINGEAMVSREPGKGARGFKQQICVQKKQNTEKICLYNHLDNVDVWWMDKKTDFIVKPTCPKGSTWKVLRPRRCFKPLNLIDSECQVPCMKENVHDGGLPPGESVGGMDANLNANVTDPRPYIHHDNDYLDRKLNMYLLMQELNVFNVTPTSNISHGPNLTFVLYDVMKDIVKNYCPSQYVPKTWVEQIVDLFHNLHHGDIFKYENMLSEEEFKWIKDILLQCKANGSKIELYHPISTDLANMCEGVQRVEGFCNSTIGEPCKQRPVRRIRDPYNDFMTKHYVPEVSWLILDLVHVICFPQFNESYRMFHLLEQTVEKLFTVQIKNYWYNPNWSEKTKSRMLGSAADDYMYNMEICAESAYLASNNAPHRLIRPDPLKYLKRRKRAVEHLSSSYDISCAKARSDFKIGSNCDNMNLGSKPFKPNVQFQGKAGRYK